MLPNGARPARFEMNPTLELVADFACHTGENPLWHPTENCVYWTDIPAGKLYRYDPATGRAEQVYEGRQVGGFTIQADGSLLLFMDRCTVVVWHRGRIERTIVPQLDDELDTRFNDVIADPEGRVFCGTMSVKDAAGNITRRGRLYRLDRDGSLHRIVEGLSTSNGMGFALDRRRMYHTDSGPDVRTIFLYDYDRASGAITNRRVFYTAPAVEGEGRPDGLTVDSEGCVWSARWDGSCVVRHAVDGQILERIAVPTKKVSCPTFGGPEYDRLYLTTAGGHERATNGATAGALYRVVPGVRGLPEFPSRVGI